MRALLQIASKSVLTPQDASCWLRKAKLPEQALERRAELLSEMARVVQLLSARATIQGSAVSVMPWKKAPLIAQWAPREDLSGSSIPVGAAADASVSVGRCVKQLHCYIKFSILYCPTNSDSASWHGTKALLMMPTLHAWLIMGGSAYYSESGEVMPQKCHRITIKSVQAGPGGGALCWHG